MLHSGPGCVPAVLRESRQELLRQFDHEQQSTVLPFGVESLRSGQESELLRKWRMQQRTDVLYQLLAAVLRTEWCDLLWDHDVQVWRNVLRQQRLLLSARDMRLENAAMPSL